MRSTRRSSGQSASLGADHPPQLYLASSFGSSESADGTGSLATFSKPVTSPELDLFLGASEPEHLQKSKARLSDLRTPRPSRLSNVSSPKMAALVEPVGGSPVQHPLPPLSAPIYLKFLREALRNIDRIPSESMLTQELRVLVELALAEMNRYRELHDEVNKGSTNGQGGGRTERSALGSDANASPLTLVKAAWSRLVSPGQESGAGSRTLKGLRPGGNVGASSASPRSIPPGRRGLGASRAKVPALPKARHVDPSGHKVALTASSDPGGKGRGASLPSSVREAELSPSLPIRATTPEDAFLSSVWKLSQAEEETRDVDSPLDAPHSPSIAVAPQIDKEARQEDVKESRGSPQAKPRESKMLPSPELPIYSPEDDEAAVKLAAEEKKNEKSSLPTPSPPEEEDEKETVDEDPLSPLFESLCNHLWTVILSAFYWKRHRLVELALSALHTLYAETTVESRGMLVALIAPSFGNFITGAAQKKKRMKSATKRRAGSVGELSTIFSSEYMDDLTQQGEDKTLGPAAGEMWILDDNRLLCSIHCGLLTSLISWLGSQSATPSKALVLRTLDIIKEMVENPRTSPACSSAIIFRLQRACISMTVESSVEEVRQSSEKILHVCASRALNDFLEYAEANPRPYVFRTRTPLDNYIDDVPPEAGFTWVNICGDDEEGLQEEEIDNGSGLERGGGEEFHRGACSLSPMASLPGLKGMLSNPSSLVKVGRAGREMPKSYNPQSFMRQKGFEDVVMKSIELALREDGTLPSPMKELMFCLRLSCRAGSCIRAAAKTASPLSPVADDKMIRERTVGLHLLEWIVLHFPCANCEYEHSCASWMKTILVACRYDLVGCIARNFYFGRPTHLFQCSLTVLGALLCKCHYPLARELHTLLAMYIIPLTLSPYSNFKQKHAVLGVVEQVFRQRHVVISHFINYDCSPSFDPNGEYKGLVELLVEFVTTLMFQHQVPSSTDPSSSIAALELELAVRGKGVGGRGRNASRSFTGQLNSSEAGEVKAKTGYVGCLSVEQQKMLHRECLAVIESLTKSMLEWATEDPKAVAKEVLRGGKELPAAGTDSGLQWSSVGTGEAKKVSHGDSKNADVVGYGECDRSGERTGARGLRDLCESEWIRVQLDLPSEEERDEIEMRAVFPISPRPTTSVTPDREGSVQLSIMTPREGPRHDYLEFLMPSWNPNQQRDDESHDEGDFAPHSRPISCDSLGSQSLSPCLPPIRLSENKLVVSYHWKHIHALRQNKLIAMEAARLIREGDWRGAKTYLEDRGLIPLRPASKEGVPEEQQTPGSTHFAPFARFLFDYPHIDRHAVQEIFSSVNKTDGSSRLVVKEYLHLFDYRDAPIDIAFRDTTCRFISWDQPMLESQVWETLQRFFGVEYAAQNPRTYTAQDAEVLAGVLLVLHASLHNKNASFRLTEKDFVASAQECLEFSVDPKALREMYRRVEKQKWELDQYGRTPQEVEAAERHEELSERVWKRWEARYAKEAARQREIEQEELKTIDRPFETKTLENGGRLLGPERSFHTTDGLSGTRHSNAMSTHSIESKLNGVELDELSYGYPMPHGSVMSTLSENEETDDSGLGETVTMMSATTWSLNGREYRQQKALQIRRGSHVGPGMNSAEQRESPLPSHYDVRVSGARKEVALLNPYFPVYTKGLDPSVDVTGGGLRRKHKAKQKREMNDLLWSLVAIEYLTKLEASHQSFYLKWREYSPQPYVVPHYAEHIRPMLSSLAPSIYAILYLAIRRAEEAPVYYTVVYTHQRLLELQAILLMSTDDLESAVEETMARHYQETDCTPLVAPARAAFVLHSYVM